MSLDFKDPLAIMAVAEAQEECRELRANVMRLTTDNAQLQYALEQSEAVVTRVTEERDEFRESYRLAMVSVNDAFDKGFDAAKMPLDIARRAVDEQIARAEAAEKENERLKGELKMERERTEYEASEGFKVADELRELQRRSDQGARRDKSVLRRIKQEVDRSGSSPGWHGVP